MGFVVLLLLIPVAVCSPAFLPIDCTDLYNKGFGQSGVYTIYPGGPVSPLQVYCDMGCGGDSDSGQWTVLQRRKDGTINFYRGWDQYKNGFGQASGEYWLGLENMHLLTLRNSYELKVEMETFEGTKAFVHYSSFSVSPELDGYKLSLDGFTDGGAGASFTAHSGLKFSTFDKDQDTYAKNCAQICLGGWWYGECHNVNPNGLYAWGNSTFGTGINWESWKGFEYSLKAITMKIKPRSSNVNK